LIAGDKVYALKGDLQEFDTLAGKTVVVAGEVKHGSMAVQSISEQK
jgi:hypothetical protein